MENWKKESRAALVSEKVSVNLNTATLSQIDLLVDGGYYSNRSDFINQALRETLDRRTSDIERLIQQQSYSTSGNKHWFMGVYVLERNELEQIELKGEKISVKGYGLLIIEEDIPNELIFNVVNKIQVRGRVLCDGEIKKRYGLK